MNECQNLQQQLDDYLGDRVSDFARRRIDSHLRQCPECADEVECYRELIGELRSASTAVKIEPSLTLEYSLNRMASTPPRGDLINRHYYTILIFGGMAMLLAATLLGLLDHFGAYQISFTISLVTGLVGSVALAGGLRQFIRRDRTVGASQNDGVR